MSNKDELFSDIEDEYKVVLVINEKHQYYGDIGRVVYHDKRREKINVEFPNEDMISFSEDSSKNNSDDLSMFYRLNDEICDPDLEALQESFIENGGRKIDLEKQYKILFGKDFPSFE